MPLSFPPNSIINMEGIGVWAEHPLPFFWVGLPNDFPHVLSVEDAFKWRWNTGLIGHAYRRTRLSDNTVLQDYSTDLSPDGIDDTTPERWVLGSNLSFSGSNPIGSVNLSVSFAAYCPNDLGMYDVSNWQFALSPEKYVNLLGAQGFIMGADGDKLIFSYESSSGSDLIEESYTRFDWL